MRTKTLLLTAAIGAAGLASSMAQTVYSVNAVGYVNTPVPNGFNLLANPLIQAAPTLANLIPNPQPGTTVYTFTAGSGFTGINTYDPDAGGWDPNPNQTLDLGDGFFIFNPGASFTITFVGEVAEGAPVSTPLPSGFSIRSSKVPQAGTVTALGLVGNAGDTIYQFSNPGGYTLIATFDPDVGGWDPAEPTLRVGEAVFFFNPGAARTWTRNFDVTP